MRRLKPGVTIVELLIVIAIIGILATLVTFAINPGKRMGQARDSTRKAALSTVSRALLAYYLDRQTYPDPGASHFVESTDGDDWIPGLKPDYLKNLPKDPKQAALMTGLATVSNKTGQVAAASMKGFPEGVIRVNGFGNRVNLEAGFFQTYPWVGGFAGIENWNDLEQTEGNNDWTYLNSLRARACTDKKPVIFIVKTGGGATTAVPNWISGSPYNRPIVNIPDATQPSLIPWDDIVRQKWLATSARIAARYDDPTVDPCNAYVAGIYVAGTQTQWPEMIFAKDPSWANVGEIFPDLPSFNSPSGSVYSDAWKAALSGMASQFNKTWLINMVDTVPDPTGPGRLKGPLDAIVTEVGANYSGKATVGTANAGYLQHDLLNTDYKYQTVRASNPALSNVKIVYEIGPKKQDEAVPNDLYIALQDCKQKLGCTAAFVHGNTWAQTTNPAEAEQAQADFWPSSLPLPTPSPSPSSSPSSTPLPTPTPSPASDFKYRYYSSGLQTFELWAILEDKEDKETYPNPLAGRTCKLDPPSGTSYNYCVAY